MHKLFAYLLIAVTLLSNGMFDVVVNCCCENESEIVETAKHSCCTANYPSKNKQSPLNNHSNLGCCEELNLYYFTPKYFQFSKTVIQNSGFKIIYHPRIFLPIIYQNKIRVKQNQMNTDEFVFKDAFDLSEISVFVI